jgi:hypothetical protein
LEKTIIAGGKKLVRKSQRAVKISEWLKITESCSRNYMTVANRAALGSPEQQWAARRERKGGRFFRKTVYCHPYIFLKIQIF